jgi:DNA-binding transcriptional ArsR family regulator
VVAAVLSPTPVCSRRVSAGVRPEPGATSARPAWWGATDWVEVEVRGAVREHRDVCRAHHVEADTVIAIARGLAHFADHRTGRDCRPTNARLVTLLRVSLSTVQRGRRVLKQLGLVVELVRGRSVMTRAERLAAWRRGSTYRRVAAEFALCSRRSRPDRSWSLPRPVERDTPPSALGDNGYLTPLGSSLRTKTETKKAAPRPATTQKMAASRRRGVDPRTRRLAEAVRRRLGWLSEVSARRLAPALHRFAQAGWTPRDVDRAVTDALATRGWRLPRRLDQPAAYLATLLRALDPEDRPGALDEHIAAVDAAQSAYERQLVTGSPCPHGQPGGDVLSPLRGHRACPLCRLGSS